MLLKLVWILIMFGGKYHQEKRAKNGISGRLDFEIFWGACPQTPLKACAFGASQLPRLSEQSGDGPSLEEYCIGISTVLALFCTVCRCTQKQRN